MGGADRQAENVGRLDGAEGDPLGARTLRVGQMGLAANETEQLGDISTLADPSVVAQLVSDRSL